MAKLTKKDVLHLAKLANLKLSQEEVERFLPQLSEILEHVIELNKVDTTGVDPTSQTTGLTNVYRADEVRPSSIDQDSALSGTDDIYNGYFKVNAILSERSDK